jgi:fructosamine-3-kinase
VNHRRIDGKDGVGCSIPGGFDRPGWLQLEPAQGRLPVSEQRRDAVGKGVDWPPGLPRPASTRPLKGGFICSTTRDRLADGREVVVKRCPYPAEVEADGLRALAAAGAPVPAVLGFANHVLVLEHVGGSPDWSALGRAIARLHRTTGSRFGWHRDYFQGMTVQHNGWSDDWPSFYVERRLRVHLTDPKVPESLRRRIEWACDGPLPALLRPRPSASLTHGDLWAANVVEGRWLVDPAVSFADRELELAYMQLSNSMPPELLAAYVEAWPPDPSYEQRRPALQLHKFLNNIRHFGPDRYVPRIEAVLDTYGW